jgi:hypothetical protein
MVYKTTILFYNLHHKHHNYAESSYQSVLYHANSKSPYESKELLGRFVGVNMTSGSAMNVSTLTGDTQRPITPSTVRSRITLTDPNLHLSPAGGELDSHLMSKPDNNNTYVQEEERQRVEDMPTGDEDPDGPLQPDKLVGRASIVRQIKTFNDETQDKTHTYFLCEVPDHEMVQIRDYQSSKQDNHNFFRLVTDTVHQGPLTPQDPNYLGTAWITFANWEDRSSTYKHSSTIGKDMLHNNLLDKSGWEHPKHRAKNKKTLDQKVKQHVLQLKYWETILIHSVEIPQDCQSTHQLDRYIHNTNTTDSEQPHSKQLFEYEFAIDRAKLKASDPTLEGYKKLHCQMIFANKQDGRHKIRFKPAQHLTTGLKGRAYSRVVTLRSPGLDPLNKSHDSLSLRSLHIITLTTKLNGLELYQADVGPGYPDPLGREQIYFKASKDFMHLEMKDLMLILYKAQYEHPKTFIDQLKAPPKDSEQGYQSKANPSHTFHLGCHNIQDQDSNMNQAPIDWLCNAQSTVARATFGSEIVAAPTTNKMGYIIRYTFRMMGIPSRPQLGKQVNDLAYHYTRKAIAIDMIHTVHVAGINYSVEYRTKVLGYQEWIQIQHPVIYWQDGTATIPTKGE